MNQDRNLYYLEREIGVSHYPMASTAVEPIQQKQIPFSLKAAKDESLIIYIHIPFCEKICAFCPYNKVLLNEAKKQSYLQCLDAEINAYASTGYIGKKKVSAIYFGGGTPSLLTAAELETILDKVQTRFNLQSDTEITIEGNPHSFDAEKLAVIKKQGGNRISLGVQSFNEKMLRILEVPHTSLDSIQMITKIKELGFEKLSIDLMYNLPKQQLAEWLEDVSQAIRLKVGHITLFHLKVIPNTRLHKKMAEGFETGDLRTEIEMFEQAKNLLLSAGYQQETTYDFILPDNESIYGHHHFLKQAEMLGMGLGAFGDLDHHVYMNAGNFRDYIKMMKAGNMPVLLRDKVSADERLNAEIVMGLRMLKTDLLPADYHILKQRYQEKLAILAKHHLIRIADNQIILTDEGRIWGNNICKEFYSEDFKTKLPAWLRMEELSILKDIDS